MVIRVLVAVAPPMLQGIIVRALESCSELRITSVAATNTNNWVEAASRIAPDAVITTVEPDESSAEYIVRHPRTKILAIKEDGRQAFLFELVPKLVPLGELSTDSLLAVIRDAVMKPVNIEW